MQQHAALEQRKARLSVGTAFDPFHFIHEALDHAIAPRLGTSIHDGFCFVSQSLHKVDQWSLARSSYRGFPVLQSRFPFPVAEKGTKCLSEAVDSCGCWITFTELVNECRLGFCALLGGTNDHESDISGRRCFLQRDQVFRDGFSPIGAKLGHGASNRAYRSCISLSYDLFIELKCCMAPIVPSLGQIRYVRIYHMMSVAPMWAAG